MSQGVISPPGLVYFANNIPGSGIDAPVTDEAGTRIGPAYRAQLYDGLALGSLKPLLPSTTFRSGNGLGYLIPRYIEVPDLPPGSVGLFMVRAYNEMDWESSNIRGESNILRLQTGGGGIIPPTELVGLQPFQVLPVPEPETIALFGFGLISFGLWRRRRVGVFLKRPSYAPHERTAVRD